MRYSCFMFYYY